MSAGIKTTRDLDEAGDSIQFSRHLVNRGAVGGKVRMLQDSSRYRLCLFETTDSKNDEVTNRYKNCTKHAISRDKHVRLIVRGNGSATRPVTSCGFV